MSHSRASLILEWLLWLVGTLNPHEKKRLVVLGVNGQRNDVVVRVTGEVWGLAKGSFRNGRYSRHSHDDELGRPPIINSTTCNYLHLCERGLPRAVYQNNPLCLCCLLSARVWSKAIAISRLISLIEVPVMPHVRPISRGGLERTPLKLPAGLNREAL